MTVLHIIIGLGIGGAELMLRRLAVTQRSSTVVSLTDLGPVGRMLQADGVEVISLGLRGIWGLPRVFSALTRLIKSKRPDIVQTWMVHADLIGGLAARLAGVHNVIWGVRTTDYSVEARTTRTVRWLCARLSYVIPVKIVAAAQASLESSIDLGYCANKFIVIQNGFDTKILQAQIGQGISIRSLINLKPDTLIVGCMGRFNPAKDQFNFVKAAGLVAQKYHNCVFLMVGKGLNPGNKDLISRVQDTKYAERFILLDERADPAVCLDAMDVFVLSSCTEGFPNVLGEAMAMGIPCVSTDVGDAAALLGDTGKLVPPRNSLALAEAIMRLLEAPVAERKAVGQRGRNRLERYFSIETATRKFDDLYATLTKGR